MCTHLQYSLRNFRRQPHTVQQLPPHHRYIVNVYRCGERCSQSLALSALSLDFLSLWRRRKSSEMIPQSASVSSSM